MFHTQTFSSIQDDPLTYTVLKTYDMALYVHNMGLLYHELQEFLKEKFSDGTIQFDPKERIIFDHHDLEFFIHKDFPGFHLYNLQLILRELDIPNFVGVVESNIPDYARDTKLVRDILRPDDVPMRAISISCEVESARQLPKQKDICIERINFAFVALSRLKRFHRTLFMAELFRHGLQQHGLVSYHNIDDELDKKRRVRINNSVCPDLKFPVFLTTTPFSMVNHEYHMTSKLKQRVASFVSGVSNYCNFKEDVDIYRKKLAMEYQKDHIQNAFLYVALETVANYPVPYQSAISFKSISQKRPFVIFGSPGCVKLLRDQGFKTFDRWWDESYDSEQDLVRRLEKIIEIVQHISSLSSKQLQALCKEMEPVLDYNYQHFTGAFIDNESAKKHKVLAQQFINYD